MWYPRVARARWTESILRFKHYLTGPNPILLGAEFRSVENDLGLFLLQRFDVSRRFPALHISRIGAVDCPNFQRIVFLGGEVPRRPIALRQRYLEALDLFVVPRSWNLLMEGLLPSCCRDGK